MNEEEELVSVYQAPDPVLAGIIAEDLRSNGIDCTVSGENQGGFTGVQVVNVDVLVRASDAERARELIRRHEPKAEEEASEEA